MSQAPFLPVMAEIIIATKARINGLFNEMESALCDLSEQLSQHFVLRLPPKRNPPISERKAIEKTRKGVRRALKKAKGKAKNPPIGERADETISAKPVTLIDWVVKTLTEASGGGEPVPLSLQELTARMRKSGWKTKSKDPKGVIQVGVLGEAKKHNRRVQKGSVKGTYQLPAA